MALSKTIVLITGATTGVGYAAAKVISGASPSYHVIIASRSLANSEKAVAELKSISPTSNLSSVQLNMTDPDSITAAVKTITDSFGRLDVLINNAGMCEAPGTAFDPEVMSSVLTTNAMGPALVSNAFLPLLQKSSKPYLINVSSGLGSIDKLEHLEGDHMWMYTAYRMSKAALNMLTLMQHKEFGPKGVKVFSMCPGLVRSNLRGKEEADISAGGRAGDPVVSGHTILNIVSGNRDEDVGKFLHKDGVWQW